MEKILLLMMIAALVFSCKTKQPLTSTRALETVNVGAAPNDGTGDPLRTAFQKVNAAIEVMNDVSLDQATGSTGTGNLVFSASPTLTGTVVLPSNTSIGDVSSTEIGYLDGVTSAIQTQIDALVPYSGATTAVDLGSNGLTTTGTGTVGILKVGDATSSTILSLDSLSTDGTTYSLYDGATQLAPAIPASGQGELSDYAKLLVDTTLYFAPCIGVGNDGDTAAFTLNNVIWGAKWEGDHSFVITKVTGVVYGTTPDIDVALLYDTNFRDDTPTEVFSSDLTVTSTTTGDEATISGNNTIAPGTWIWLRVDEATAKPKQLIINIYGYLDAPPASESDYPSVLDDGNTLFWGKVSTDYMTVSNDSISEWEDYLGGSVTLTASGDARPVIKGDSIIFDGIDDYLTYISTSIDQPLFFYIVFSMHGWTDENGILGGHLTQSVYLKQDYATPRIIAYAGSVSNGLSDLAEYEKGIVRCLFNGANSLLIINENAGSVDTDFGTNDPQGINIGKGSIALNYMPMAVWEVIIRNTADSEVNQAVIMDYLQLEHGL